MNDEKRGKIFIAYHGSEINEEEIKNVLETICPNNYTVKSVTSRNCNNVGYGNNLILVKTVYNRYLEDRDPIYSGGTAAVSGYDQNEIERACNAFRKYEITDSDRYHDIVKRLYSDRKEQVFNDLSEYMQFCSVIWNNNEGKLIAGVTNSNNEYNHLYYGLTRNNNELIYSNNKDVLKRFCSKIEEMSPNTYIKDNKIYDLHGTEISELKSDEISLIKKDKKNADSLIDGLNALLIQITSDSVREKIEKNVDDYLASDDPKKQIEDYLLNELDLETQKQILSIIKGVLEEQRVQETIDREIKDTLDTRLEEYSKQVQVPVVHIIKLNETTLGQTKGGFYHEKFNQILTQIQLDEPIMLIGPAGSGKNVAIQQVADALGKHMYYTNNASNEFKLTGFIDAGGNYRDTEFYKAFKNGGVFFLDEIDNSDPSALIVINSALANGYMAFPHETIDRHPDFRIVAAANTWGKGADLQYVGRNALDAATLDRFDNIFFDYDKKLEEALYPNEEVLKFMWAFRDAVLKTKIPHVVSTRGIGKVYKKEINGIPVEDTLTSNIVKNLSQDDVNTIIGNMHDINNDNKYYDGIKRLVLRK